LDALLLFVETRLQETLQFARFGLTAADALAADESIEFDDIELPEVLIQLGRAPLSMPELRSGFSEWLVGVCLRRYIEVYQAFLDIVGPVALLGEFQRESFDYDSGEIFRTFNGYTFPQKLDRIDKALSQQINPTFRQYIESINHARNCFEHRNGVVSHRDLNTEGQCIIAWRGADTFVRASEADEWEQALTVPVVVPPLGHFMMKWTARERSFAIGDHLRFSPKDISEMGTSSCYMLSRFAMLSGKSFNLTNLPLVVRSIPLTATTSP